MKKYYQIYILILSLGFTFILSAEVNDTAGVGGGEVRLTQSNVPVNNMPVNTPMQNNPYLRNQYSEHYPNNQYGGGPVGYPNGPSSNQYGGGRYPNGPSLNQYGGGPVGYPNGPSLNPYGGGPNQYPVRGGPYGGGPQQYPSSQQQYSMQYDAGQTPNLDGSGQMPNYNPNVNPNMPPSQFGNNQPNVNPNVNPNMPPNQFGNNQPNVNPNVNPGTPPTQNGASQPQGGGPEDYSIPLQILSKISDFKSEMTDLNEFCSKILKAYGNTDGYYVSLDGRNLVICNPTPSIYYCPENKDIDPKCFPGQKCQTTCSDPLPRPLYPESFITFTVTDLYFDDVLKDTYYGVTWYDYKVGQERLEMRGIVYVTENTASGVKRKVYKETFDPATGKPNSELVKQYNLVNSYQRSGVPQVASLEGWESINGNTIFNWRVVSGGASPLLPGEIILKTTQPYFSENDELLTIPIELTKSYMAEDNKKVREVTKYLHFDRLEGVAGTYIEGRFYPQDHQFSMRDWFAH